MSKEIKQKNSKYPNFDQAFKRPPLVISKEFSLWICDNNSSTSRLGIIVRKKCVKLAVDRNYAKRLSRELFKKYQNLFVNKDIVLVVKKFEPRVDLPVWKIKLEGAYRCLSHFANT